MTIGHQVHGLDTLHLLASLLVVVIFTLYYCYILSITCYIYNKLFAPQRLFLLGVGALYGYLFLCERTGTLWDQSTVKIGSFYDVYSISPFVTKCTRI